MIEASTTANTLFVGVGPGSGPQLISSYADFTAVFGAQVTPLSLTVYQFFQNGGVTATVRTVAQASATSLNAGLAAAREDDFNLLVLPDLGLLNSSDADSVSANALALATANRAMFLLDLPENISTPAQAQNWFDNHPQLRQNQLAAYWPWLPVVAPNGSNARIGPSSALAGIYATVDSQVGVWRNPAGLEFPLKNVDLPPADPQTVLNLNSILVENQAVVCWGARTLSGQPIGPQRLQSFLASSLINSLEWTAFEPSGELLFETVTRLLSQFLTTLWQQGALFGSTSSQAFQVVCDPSNNPPVERLQGILRVMVFYAPVFPSQFQSIELTTLCQPAN